MNGIVKATVTALALLASCSGNDKEKEAATRCARDFACDFFNFRYVDAVKYVDNGSRRVLEFCASNMSEKIIDSLKNIVDTPSVSVEEAEIAGNGEAECKVTVEDEITVDTIGGLPARSKKESTYKFKLVKEGNAWKVRMAKLPRSEK